MESKLIGAVVKTNNLKSDFSHYDEDEDDENVEGMIVECVTSSDSTAYLIMDKQGKIYQTDYDDIDEIVSFGGVPTEYLRPKKKPFEL